MARKKTTTKAADGTETETEVDVVEDTTLDEHTAKAEVAADTAVVTMPDTTPSLAGPSVTDPEAVALPPIPQTDPVPSESVDVTKDLGRLDQVSYHRGCGETVLFAFEDRGEYKVRPALIVDGKDESDELDLYVIFSPHDNLSGVNASPQVMLGIKHASNPDVQAAGMHPRCWFPR